MIDVTPKGPVSGVIIPPVQDTCGNCRFGKLIAVGATECWGVPPTPVLMGARQNVAGQVEANIELMRARQASNTAGCALWRERGLEFAPSQGRG